MKSATRRRVFALFAAVLLSAAIGYGTSRVAAPNNAAQPAIVARVALSEVNVTQFVAANGRLLLVSYNSGPANDCDINWIDPVSLRLSATLVTSCNSPSVQAEGAKVWPAVVTNMSMYGNVRIATGGSSGVRLGPDVMPFENISGGARPQWIYGDGYLWIYDVGPHAGQGGGASLLRVSDTTGTLDARISMPDLYRPTMAVNEDGLWMGASPGESGGAVLYHVSQRADRPQTFKLPGSAFSGIFATGSDLYLETMSYAGYSTFWHLRGRSAEVVARAPATPATTLPQFVGADGRLWSAIASPKGGGWTGPGALAQFGIVVDQVNPATGRPVTSTSLPVGLTTEGAAWQDVFFDGDAYLLNPAMNGEELFKVSL